MSTASIGGSVTSIADSLEDEEFLLASPFHPKNVRFRRVVHDSSRLYFQPRFERIDSMGYRGQKIVEEMNNTAPISYPRSRLSPIPYLRKPAAANLLAEAEMSTRPPLSAHVPQKMHPHHGFLPEALCPRVTCSRGPAESQSGSSPRAVPSTTAMRVAATSSFWQAQKSITTDAPPSPSLEGPLGSGARACRQLLSAVFGAENAMCVPPKDAESIASAPQKAAGGSECRKPAMQRHPLLRGPDPDGNAFGCTYGSDLLVHVPCKNEWVERSHSDEASLTGANQLRTTPALFAGANVPRRLSSHSASLATLAVTACLPASRLRFPSAERSASSGGGLSPLRSALPQGHTAVLPSATRSQLGTAHATNLTDVPALPTRRLSAVPLLNRQRAERNGSVSSALLRHTISRCPHSFRVRPQCTAEVSVTKTSEFAAFGCLPRVSRRPSALNHSNGPGSKNDNSTPSAALDSVCATAPPNER
ncbi:hypothetical protein LSCM1_01186 [Leishmania martiniquensis]|uniref:Uncharacterized protein n=1 Tax=Leishmania martiniquensis TaxID=1580590 RepID=A0A836FQ47_9TRYP|nr:hypothetical protein LSCM1_01186 [Leishmania martiniquensis]